MRRQLTLLTTAALVATALATMIFQRVAADQATDDRPRPASELRVIGASDEGQSDDTRLAKAAGRPDYARRKRKVDPVEANGPIFVDWPQPQAALLFSGAMNGYLEPCGCTGLENQKGGLKRRHTLIKQLESQGWPIVKLDMGGLVRRLGPQAEIKFRFALESLIELGYSAIGLGANDLQLSSDALVFALINLDPQDNPVTSANVAFQSFDSGLTTRYRTVNVGSRRIGVASVLAKSHQKALENTGDWVYVDPVRALTDVVGPLAAQQCDLQVLLVHGSPDEAAELALRFPQFQIVGASDGAEEPPRGFRKIEHSKSKLVEVGHKGTYVVVVGLYDDPQQPIRIQRVPLDHRFDDSPQMQRQMVEYQEELKLQGLEGLGLNGTANPRGEYAGSAVCADCHTEAYEVFEASKHFHATDSLVEISDPPRQFDPECLSCHATGWHPKEYFPYKTGFTTLAETPHLAANGCENCHGPAAAHAAVESGDEDATEEMQESLRAALRLRIVENEGNKEGQVYGDVVKNCMRCHDTDNSPDFNFQEYWNRDVKHTGKE